MTMRLFAIAFLMFVHAAVAGAADVAELRERSQRLEGFIPLLWDADGGKLYLELAAFDSPLIYYSSLSHGVGSNDLGLDRGQLGDTQLVQFQRVGKRVLLLALNTGYRATSDSDAERVAVEQAFAQSVLWGFEIVGEDSAGVLVDATEFALRDSHGLARRLKARGEGSFKVDTSRSVIFAPRTKAFPDNSEIDALVTFTGEPEGAILATVAPDPGAITVHLHHSFVRLPEDGYTPLPYDPRTGYIDAGWGRGTVFDYGTPIDEPVRQTYAWRHRLEKKDPNAERSEAVEPIVYYVDRGVPEPVRSALMEGASWWNQAFEAAGYIDAFQVKLLPEGADPMDVRYNVIQWVHRSTRGWSYGSSVRDPRTQEILKGHVSLGSLRVRQDYLLAEGLLAPYDSGADNEELMAFALARIRQLAAHEVGHTLGLEHNFAASADDRASVMDYPHPYARLVDGRVDLSDAYDRGIGDWDKLAITWGYQHFPASVDPEAGRAALVADILDSGLGFIADRHSRSGQSCHSRSSLWDNGDDPVAELDRLMALRSVVLDNFSERVIRAGDSYARIEDVLVPAYLMHRYQLEAAAKVLGGQDFSYALRGDGQVPVRNVAPKRQRAALDSLLATLSPEALALAPELVALISPRPPGSGDSRELFPRQTGDTFDPLAAADTAIQATLAVLLEPTRAVRLNQLAVGVDGQPAFRDVLDALLAATWYADRDSAAAPLQRRVQVGVLEGLIGLVMDATAETQVRAEAADALTELDDWLDDAEDLRNRSWRAHYRFASERIDGLEAIPATERLAVPPGSPI